MKICIVCLDRIRASGRERRCDSCYTDDPWYWKPAPIPYTEIFEDAADNSRFTRNGCLVP